MLADKMAAVIDTRAEVCTAGDSSCLMHIGGGLSRMRSAVRTVHLAEILASTEARTDGHFLGVPGTGNLRGDATVPGRGPARARQHPDAPQRRARHPNDPHQTPCGSG